MSDETRSTVEPVLLSVTRVETHAGSRTLTGASGFFFRRAHRLYLVTNRHVVYDEASDHFPDRLEILTHLHTRDLTLCSVQSLPLYRDGLSLWRDAADSAGTVDIALIELEMSAMPAATVLQAFDETHLEMNGESIGIGDPLAVIGFPLGFHDTVHHLAVSRSASIASAYGVRFQGQGYFLTDARTHRGSSGSPVLRRRLSRTAASKDAHWQLLGVHSTRMDMTTRDAAVDESLGLNCAWYTDVLMTLTR